MWLLQSGYDNNDDHIGHDNRHQGNDDDNNDYNDGNDNNDDEFISQEISNNFEQLYTEHKQEFANVWKEIARRLKLFSSSKRDG